MNMKYAMRSEDTEQINVVSWANWNVNRYPELRWLFHVPNGGSRNKQEAVKFKQMGVKAGVSDLCLPYPKGSYCGLFVEMKFGNNRQQDTQKEFLADMAAAGHFVATCYSAEEAIKVMKAEKAAGQQVSESDTETEIGMNPPEVRAGDDYETPHPEGITSICYSCTEYETCNVKTGTCTSCDQYKNRTEAYKTDEQRYSEEQDAIDRETKKKLREMEQEEKMQNLPSDTQETGQKVHQIRLAKSYFDDVANGIKTFELRKNDRGYKKGDILEMMEFADGKNTGRMVRVLVTYILEDYTGIEDGYCIMATKLMKDGEEHEL